VRLCSQSPPMHVENGRQVFSKRSDQRKEQCAAGVLGVRRRDHDVSGRRVLTGSGTGHGSISSVDDRSACICCMS
jgi:hypothetical protein